MTTAAITDRMITEYCRKRIAPHLLPSETEALRRYLSNVLQGELDLPREKSKYDWLAIGLLSGVDRQRLSSASQHIEPVLGAIRRASVRKKKPTQKPPAAKSPTPRPPRASLSRMAEEVLSGKVSPGAIKAEPTSKPKRVYQKRPVVEFPTPSSNEWQEPDTFAEALRLHMQRHGDSVRHLFHAVARDDRATNQRTMMRWLAGTLVPRSIRSLEVLERIERRYRLPSGYFKAKLPHPGRARLGHALEDFTPAERRRLAWHLPDDFNSRPRAEQEEILEWVNRVIVAGSTDYRAFQAAAIKNRYAVRFRAFQGGRSLEFWRPARKPESIAIGIGAFGEASLPVPDQQIYEHHRLSWVTIATSPTEK